MKQRTSILKTYKLYINGQFPRTESGRYFQIYEPRLRPSGASARQAKKPLANVSQGSRKDLREAVKAARTAQPGWQNKTAYNRGQILYRMAEVMESRKAELIEEIVKMTGWARNKAEAEIFTSIDRLVWYAGWADKYQQIFGTVNPVAAPYFNFTLPEPMGVIGILADEEAPLLPLISVMAPALVSGNTLVIVASEKYPLSAITFAEVLATSDVPAGVVNIITGFKNELSSHLAKHMDVNAINFSSEEAAANVKRTVRLDAKSQSPYHISAFVEMKTTWHPVGV